MFATVTYHFYKVAEQFHQSLSICTRSENSLCNKWDADKRRSCCHFSHLSDSILFHSRPPDNRKPSDAPRLVILLSFTGWGIGLLLAPIACKVPDVLNLINFLVRAGFFLSPVMWTYDMFNTRFGEGWHAIVAHMNPTVVPITGMRDAVLGESSQFLAMDMRCVSNRTSGLYLRRHGL